MKLITVSADNKGVDILSDNFENIFHVDALSRDSWINDLDLSVDDAYLAIAYLELEGSHVAMWDIVNGIKLMELKDPNCNRTNPMFSVSFIDMDRLMIRDSYGQISIWHWMSKERLNVIETNWDRMSESCISLEGYIISGRSCIAGEEGDNSMIAWWDPNTGEEMRSIGFKEYASAIAYSPHNNLVAIGLENGDIAIDSVDKSNCWNADDSTVVQLCFVPDGSKVVSSFDSSAMKLWNITGQLIWERKGIHTSYFLSCTILDGQVKVAGSSLTTRNVVEVVDCETANVDRTFEADRGLFFSRPSLVVLM